jgi:hypothetical protein
MEEEAEDCVEGLKVVSKEVRCTRLRMNMVTSRIAETVCRCTTVFIRRASLYMGYLHRLVRLQDDGDLHEDNVRARVGAHSIVGVVGANCI